MGEHQANAAGVEQASAPLVALATALRGASAESSRVKRRVDLVLAEANTALAAASTGTEAARASGDQLWQLQTDEREALREEVLAERRRAEFERARAAGERLLLRKGVDGVDVEGRRAEEGECLRAAGGACVEGSGGGVRRGLLRERHGADGAGQLHRLPCGPCVHRRGERARRVRRRNGAANKRPGQMRRLRGGQLYEPDRPNGVL